MKSPTTTPSSENAQVQHARRAWELLGTVASGDAIKARDASTREATFSMLRHIASEIIGHETTDEKQDELAKVTMQRVRDLLRVASAHAPVWCTSEEVEVDSAALQDAALSFAAQLTDSLTSELRRIGPTGAEHAENIRAAEAELASKNKSDPWRLWRLQNRNARFLKLLADALWFDQVQPTLERMTLRRPALIRDVYQNRIVTTMTGQIELFENDVRDLQGMVLGHIALTTDTTIDKVRLGAQALGTVPGNRLIRALIHRSHDAWNRGVQDPRRVAFEGGWQGLMKELGIPQKDHSLLRAIAAAGQCIQWENGRVTAGGLWTWTERRGTRSTPGEVAFTLGDALTPGYADVLARSGGNHLGDRIGRQLVPELRFEPPMGGARERDHGPIWTLHRLMLLDFVEHAEELAAQGAVVISRGRWLEMARQAGVSEKIVDRTLDAWVAGEDETAPALLTRLDTSAWTLADKHAPERDFIAAGGLKRTAGRRRRTSKPKGTGRIRVPRAAKRG